MQAKYFLMDSRLIKTHIWTDFGFTFMIAALALGLSISLLPISMSTELLEEKEVRFDT